jgi:hypothetical protein
MMLLASGEELADENPSFGGVSNLPIRAKLRDYKWHRPDALVGFPSSRR